MRYSKAWWLGEEEARESHEKQGIKKCNKEASKNLWAIVFYYLSY